MDGLTRFRVTLREDLAENGRIFFDCWAEDEIHAEEQALNAYPDGEVIATNLLP